MSGFHGCVGHRSSDRRTFWIFWNLSVESLLFGHDLVGGGEDSHLGMMCVFFENVIPCHPWLQLDTCSECRAALSEIGLIGVSIIFWSHVSAPKLDPVRKVSLNPDAGFHEDECYSEPRS